VGVGNNPFSCNFLDVPIYQTPFAEVFLNNFLTEFVIIAKTYVFIFVAPYFLGDKGEAAYT
jgi:hypothetical protein